MKRIGFYNKKGGVGKSTLCYFMAGYLAHLGYRVTLLDVDSEQHSCVRRIGFSSKNGVEQKFEVLTVGERSRYTEKPDFMLVDIGGEISEWPNKLDLIVLPTMSDRDSIMVTLETARKLQSINSGQAIYKVAHIDRRDSEQRGMLETFANQGFGEVGMSLSVRKLIGAGFTLHQNDYGIVRRTFDVHAKKVRGDYEILFNKILATQNIFVD